MKLYQLRTFVATAEHGSISAAARRLCLTTSTASAHISALESEYGIELFTRSRSGAALTATGACLVKHANHALAAAERFKAQASARRNLVSGQLRLAYSVTEKSFSLSTFVAAIADKHAAVTLQLSRADSAEILKQIQAGSLDIGLIYGRANDADIGQRAVGEAQLVIAMPRKWREKHSVAGPSLGQLPWINTGEDCPFQGLSARLFAKLDIQPPQLMRVNDDRARRQLVIGGLGISLLDQHDADHPDIHLPALDPLPCPLSLIYQRRRQFDPLIAAACDLLPRLASAC